MKGCGGKFLSFVVGFIMGIVFVFGAVFGTVYIVATQTKVSGIENKINNGEKLTEGTAIGEMTLYDVFVKTKGMVSDGNLTIAAINEQFGIDVLDILENMLGFKIDGSDVYVRVADVLAVSFDAEGQKSADSVDRYVFNEETKAFEKVVALTDDSGIIKSYQQVPLGRIYDVEQTESGNVLTYKGEKVTERCTVVNDKLVTAEDGDYFLASKNSKEKLLATPIFEITNNINVLLDLINLDFVSGVLDVSSIKEIKVMAEGSYLPILSLMDILVDTFNNIDKKSIADVQEMTGITIINSDNLLSSLIDVPICELMNEAEKMEIGKLIKANRDSFVKYTDLQTEAAPLELVEYGNGFKEGKPTQIGTLTLNSESGVYTSDVKHNEDLYKWEAKHLGKVAAGSAPQVLAEYFVISAAEKDGEITFSLASLEGGEAAINDENRGNVYLRIRTGDGIMNALSPLSLNDVSAGKLSDKINDLKLSDVLGEDDMTGVLANFKDTKIGELSDRFKDLTLKEVIDIYEEDVYDAEGNLVHEKSSAVLIKFKDTKVNDLSSAFNDLVLSDVMDIYEEDVYDTEGNLIHEKSNKALIKLKDTKVNDLGTEFNNLVLSDVVDIETENVCERLGTVGESTEASNEVAARSELYFCIGTSTVATGFEDFYYGTYKVMRIENEESASKFGAFAKVTYDAEGNITNDGYTASSSLYRMTAKASNPVFIALGDVKVSEIANRATEVIDDMRLDEVMDVDGNVYVKSNTTPSEADKVNYYVLDHDMYIAYDPTNTAHQTATTFYSIRYEGSANAIIKKIATVKVKDMSTSIDVAIDNTYVREIIDIRVKSDFEHRPTDGEYVVFDSFATIEEAHAKYKGTYEIMENEDGVHVMVKHKDGMTGERYHLISAASNSAIANVADVKVGKMADGMDEVIDNMILSEAMIISGDVFEKFVGTPTEEQKEGLYVFDMDMFLKYDAALHVDETEFYSRVYEGAGNAILKKLATVSVQNIPTRINTAIDETVLSEIVSVGPDANVVLRKVQNVKIKDLSAEINKAVDDSTLGEIITIDESSHIVLQRLADVKVGELGTSIGDVINNMKLGELISITDTTSILYALRESTLNSIEADSGNLLRTSSILELYKWSGATINPALKAAIEAYEATNGTLTVEAFLSHLTVDAEGKIYLAI